MKIPKDQYVNYLYALEVNRLDHIDPTEQKRIYFNYYRYTICPFSNYEILRTGRCYFS